MKTRASSLLPNSIPTKLAMMVVACVVFMGLVAVTVLLIARAQLVVERTEKAHAMVDAVWHMAESFQHAAEAGQITDAEAKARLFAASGAIRWEGGGNYSFIFDTETGLCVMDTGNPALLGKDVRTIKDSKGFTFFAKMLEIAKVEGEGTLQYVFYRGTDQSQLLDKVAYVRNFAPWHLAIGSAEFVTDIDTTFWAMTRTAGLVIGILILLCIGIAWAITRSVVRPLAALKTRMAGLSDGELHSPVADTERRDEIGEMARTVGVFQAAMIESNRLRAEQHETAAHEQERRRSDATRLANEFEAAIGEIVATVSSASSELELSARTLTATAEHSQQLATNVAAASEEASSNVQSVASASEQMTSSVDEISRQVQESARIAGDAVEQARHTSDRVGELSQAAGRIGAVVELINTIAGQTNLLALNATIEAARAGDAGRGFAVVASEVKALAEQTAKATSEISQQIDGIQSATRGSVNAIKEISTTIKWMSEISSTIAQAVEEQGAATQEIARNVQQAAQGTRLVSSNIVEVQRGASQTDQASAKVLTAAQSLSKDSGRLRHEIDNLLRTIRAA